MLSFHLHLGLPSGLFPQAFLQKPCFIFIVTCWHRTTVSMSHADPKLLYPCHLLSQNCSIHATDLFIILISIPHGHWFNTGIRYSLWESRKLNGYNLCIHKLSNILQLWLTLKLKHSQTTGTWLWRKLQCCEM